MIDVLRGCFAAYLVAYLVEVLFGFLGVLFSAFFGLTTRARSLYLYLRDNSGVLIGLQALLLLGLSGF